MIGILGGTFDPVHYGHLRPALDVFQSLGLERLSFVPLRVAVHRPQPQASSEARLAMLEAAIEGQAGFAVDPRELRRQTPSYTHETLMSLRDELGSRRSLCLLIGADAFAGFLSWYRPMEILELAHLVVMCRPGYDPASEPAPHRLYRERGCEDAADLRALPAGRIQLRDVTQLGISSTRIRRLIAEGGSPRYLLPDPVLDYIERTGLYRSNHGF
ncbi:nicotinate-nucleotide adenylyltransferase [Imhoffiella purpurea]|uniref:Probable nicotinate-nucleotide adenylyltransferase n=1 Tax=Imhoffiella purpurea TaxID=1249627 RepID=W9V4T8_9GAMM|nr:nicotinate-nucleotide adenylyltransferase [Imhoffiella purpurea]EXJ14319.1 Nicotinate-nucleotide adenylyltransferase [Imhoffiella purpurea]